jgi:hypothetical protein
MSKSGMVLKIDSSQFTIRLYEDLLKIDLKGSFKNEIEEGLENKPILKETIGKILGIFVPLHIQVDEIRSVYMDETGKTIISLLNHRDVVLPFECKEDAMKLVEKLKQMISIAKTRERAKIELRKVRRKAGKTRFRKRPRAERRV